MTAIGDLLVEFKEQARDGDYEVLTLTEKRGFVRQAERFNKRLATDDTSKYKVIRRGDIAFNPYLVWAGAVAQNTIIDAGIISPLYPTFRVRPSFDPRYVGLMLLAPRMVALYDGIAFGSVPRRRRTSVADFLNLEVPTPPPIDEQRRIAAILQRSGEVLSRIHRCTQGLSSLEGSLFIKHFGDPTIGRATSTVVRFESLAANERHAIVDGPFGSALGADDYVDQGVPIIRVGNVSADGALLRRNFLHIRREKFLQLKRSALKANDVLVTRVGTLGNACIFPADFGDALLSTTGVCKITLDPEIVLPSYVLAAIQQPAFQRQIQRSASSSVQKYFNLSAMKGWAIQLPSLSEQRLFECEVGAVTRQRFRVAGRLRDAEALHISLQARAFSGRL